MYFKRKPQETTTFGSLAVGAVFCWPGDPSHPAMKTTEWKDHQGLTVSAVSLTGLVYTSVSAVTEVIVVNGAFVGAD